MLQGDQLVIYEFEVMNDFDELIGGNLRVDVNGPDKQRSTGEKIW